MESEGPDVEDSELIQEEEKYLDIEECRGKLRLWINEERTSKPIFLELFRKLDQEIIQEVIGNLPRNRRTRLGHLLIQTTDIGDVQQE